MIQIPAEEAANALELYQTITDHTSRALFLASFERESGGPGKLGFKWTHDFKKTLDHQNITEVGATENMLSRPQILKHIGLSLADFKTQQQALDFADVEIARNKAEFEHQGETEKSSDGPLHDRFQFVVGHGKKRTWRQVEGKQLQGQSACNSVEGLKQAKQFMEAMGQPSAAQPSDVTGPKNISDEEKILNINLAETGK